MVFGHHSLRVCVRYLGIVNGEWNETALPETQVSFTRNKVH